MKLPFFLEKDNEVELPYILSANPHYYDYFHTITFGDQETMEFANGAGQGVNGGAQGKYRIDNIKDT